jgi:hypothetical protein
MRYVKNKVSLTYGTPILKHILVPIIFNFYSLFPRKLMILDSQKNERKIKNSIYSDNYTRE